MSGKTIDCVTCNKVMAQIRKILKKLWNLIKQPETGLLVGLTGVILTIFFYFASISRVEPKYAISQPEEIVSQIVNDSNFKIFWGDKEIENLFSVKVALWNSGRKYFDNNDVSTDLPLTIVPSINENCEKVRIFSAEIVERSRENLDFELVQQDQTQNIQLKIAKDDSIDQDDGIVIRLLYEGDRSCEFNIIGRIKGTKGFKKVDWKSVAGSNDNLSFKLHMFLVYITLTLFLIYFYTEFLRSFSAETSKSIRNISLALGVIAIILAVLIIVGFYFFPVIIKLFFPNWIR